MKKWQISNNEEIIAQNDSEFDYKKLLGSFIDRWWLFLASLTIACTIAFLANRYITPIYMVTSSLLVKAEKEIANPISDLFYGDEFFGRNSTNIDNETSLLESYHLIEKTLRDLDLNVSYFKEGKVRDDEIYTASPIKFTLLDHEQAPYGQMFVCSMKNDSVYNIQTYREPSFYDDLMIKLGLQKVKGLQIKKGGLRFGEPVTIGNFEFAIDFVGDPEDFIKEVLFKVENYSKLTKTYRKDLSVVPKSPESSIINLSLEGAVPNKVMDFLNQLMSNYIDGELDQKNFTAQRTIEFIDHQIGFTGDSLRSVEKEMENFKKSSTPVGLSQEGSQLSSSLEAFEDQRLQLNLTIKYLEDQKDYLLNDNYEQLVTPSSLGIEDDNLNRLIVELISSYSDIRLRESQENLNPLVRLKVERMENLKISVLDNIQSLLATYRFRVETLDSQIAAVRFSMRKLPTAERELIDMQRKQTLNEELYIFLMQKKFEAGIAKSSNVPDYRIVNQAVIKGTVPVRPSPSLNYAFAIFLGLVIPAVIILLYDLLNNKITSKKELTKLTSIPILGQIPRSVLRDQRSLVTSASPRSGISESFRNLRSNLRYLKSHQTGCETFLITSSISGEGKSFCSNNLAFIFSNFGKKVVLINADMRKRYSYEEFGIQDKLGLSDLLAGMAVKSDVLYKSKYKNLSIITAGKIPPNPSELLINGRFETIIEELKQDFDYIILDTPPIGILADGLELMNLADINLFVVRQGYSFKKDMEEANSVYKTFTNLGIILNDVKLRKRKYGYGYYEEDEVQSKFKKIFTKKWKVA